MFGRIRAAVTAFCRPPSALERTLTIKVRLDRADADRGIAAVKDSIAGAIQMMEVLEAKLKKTQLVPRSRD